MLRRAQGPSAERFLLGGRRRGVTPCPPQRREQGHAGKPGMLRSPETFSPLPASTPNWGGFVQPWEQSPTPGGRHGEPGGLSVPPPLCSSLPKPRQKTFQAASLPHRS